jgi:hypothetical protein
MLVAMYDESILNIKLTTDDAKTSRELPIANVSNRGSFLAR